MPYTPAPPPEVSLEEVESRIKRHGKPQGGVTKRGPDRAFVIHNALRAGESRISASRAAGIDPVTLYRWMADEPEMARLVEEGEAAAEAVYTQTIFAAAAGGTWQAAAWWLERRRPALYGRKDRMDVTVDMRLFVEAIARQEGLNPDTLLAEAMSIMDAHNSEQRLLGDGVVRSPFEQVVYDLTRGCGCACHFGTGYRSSCLHCWKPVPRPTVIADSQSYLRDPGNAPVSDPKRRTV